MIEDLKNIGVTEHYLPEICYTTTLKDGYLVPRPLTVYGVTIHGFSAKNISHLHRFDQELNWELMHDINYKKDERKYTYKRPEDPEDRSYASAHLMTHRNGDTEIMVPLEFQAYHAGASTWEGRVGLNKYHLGYEFVGADGEDYTDEQYEMGGQVLKIIMEYNQLDLSDLPGHYQASPRRKQDPWQKTQTQGGWDWNKLYEVIRS